MSIFSRKTEQRVSLETFKKNASGAAVIESIATITGGALAGCHPGKQAAVA
jgi:hypothetical protein